MTTIARRRHRRSLTLGAIAAIALLAVGTAPAAQAAPTPGDRLRLATTDERAAAERRLDLLADRVEAALGERRTAGAYIDRSGDLVVTVTSRAAATAVRAAGATPARVRFSARQLDAVQDHLDGIAASRGVADGIYGWYVDVRDNAVVVTAGAGRRGPQVRSFLTAARSFGDRVVVERSAAAPVSAAYLYGGQEIAMSTGGRCSNGFNATNSSGRYVLITAGHCAEGYPTFYRNGTKIGRTRAYSFPTNDYAAVKIASPSYWNPQGAVDMYNGYARVVRGYSSAPVGSSLCKSGRTTGWTCGTIQAYNQTVNYGGDVVYGLVRHSACVEQGDSGGSNMNGNYAQGVSSGGQLYSSGGRLVCGQKVGQPNVSYYQPVQEALSAYGLRLITG
ncbi:MAG: S1 family peptidase [Actinomycetota bacterium]|nr:S1 family peptidase [Actinomycetota bacterium]